MLGTFLKGATKVAGERSLIVGQTQVNYDGSGGNGTFSSGRLYAVSEVITLSNGATILVEAVSTGFNNVQQFSVTTTGPAESGVTLTQASSTGNGRNFTLTPGPNNLE